MTRPLPRRPEPSRAAVLTLADDLNTIARIEAAMRLGATARPRHPRAGAMLRFADWLASLR